MNFPQIIHQYNLTGKKKDAAVEIQSNLKFFHALFRNLH